MIIKPRQDVSYVSAEHALKENGLETCYVINNRNKEQKAYYNKETDKYYVITALDRYNYTYYSIKLKELKEYKAAYFSM
jgi:hypothetical protein